MIAERTRSLIVPDTVERWKRAAVAAVKVMRSAQVEPLVECWILNVADAKVEATEVTWRCPTPPPVVPPAEVVPGVNTPD